MQLFIEAYKFFSLCTICKLGQFRPGRRPAHLITSIVECNTSNSGAMHVYTVPYSSSVDKKLVCVITTAMPLHLDYVH